MTTGYVDGSALLRVILGEPLPGIDLASYDHLLASEIIEVEVARRIDRFALAGLLPNSKLDALRELASQYLQTIDLVEVDRVIIFRSTQSFGVPLGTLDAIHFATAMLWRERHLPDEFIVLTHDRELAHAARRNGIATNLSEEKSV